MAFPICLYSPFSVSGYTKTSIQVRILKLIWIIKKPVELNDLREGMNQVDLSGLEEEKTGMIRFRRGFCSERKQN